MALTTGGFGIFLFDVLKDVYGDTYAQLPKIYPQLVEEEDSNQAFEKYAEMVTFSLVPEFAQGSSVGLDTARLGYVTTFTHLDYSLGYEVTHQLLRDDQTKRIMALPAQLADAVNRTVETIVANLFNRASSGSYTYADGKSLLAVDHPTDGGTRANTPSATISGTLTQVGVDVTTTGWQEMDIELADWRDARGNRINVGSTLAFGNPFNKANFKRVIMSSDDPSTAKRAINPFYNDCKFVTSPYLTSQKSWFVKTSIPKGGARWFWREKPRFMEMAVQDRMVERHMVHFAGSAGVDNWRAYWGSPGIS
jgi:hypothetical protein